jgi:hypothetical protein
MSQSRLCSRATVSTLVIFEALALIIFALFLYAAFERHAGWDGAIVGSILCIAIFFWWRSFSVEINDSELRYRSIFSAEKVIELQNITRAVRKIELISQGNRPPNRIEIYGTLDGKEVQFDINVKPFPLADVKRMEQLLKVV